MTIATIVGVVSFMFVLIFGVIYCLYKTDKVEAAPPRRRCRCRRNY